MSPGHDLILTIDRTAGQGWGCQPQYMHPKPANDLPVRRGQHQCLSSMCGQQSMWRFLQACESDSSAAPAVLGIFHRC